MSNEIRALYSKDTIRVYQAYNKIIATTIYTGPVGPQGGVYVGGYNVMQTYIDAQWTFEVVGKTPLQ